VPYFALRYTVVPDYLERRAAFRDEHLALARLMVVSNTRTAAQHNTRIVGGSDAIEQLSVLRANTEGLIGVGGATPVDR